MKKLTLLILSTLIVMLLMSCSTKRMQPYVSDAALKEKWMRLVVTDPNTWLRNVDPWFLAGDLPLPPMATLKIIPLKNFTHIRVAGNFKVHIVGGQAMNSVAIEGPKELTNRINVNVFNNSLDISEIQEKEHPINLQSVTIHIGVHKLRSLTNLGNSLILGRTIISKDLKIQSHGSGSLLLAGKMNIKEVNHTSTGTLTLFGVEGPALNVFVNGPGNVNIQGNVHLKTIEHVGDGCLNIIGGQSEGACIHTAGNGVTSLFGYMNIREIIARNGSQVFAYWVYSPDITIMQQDQSVVGVAGSAGNMNVALKNNACFQGEYLRSCVVYIKSKDYARADVAADTKIFASTAGSSYIYYFGSPNILTSFNSHYSTIIPLGNYLNPVIQAPPGAFQPPSFCSKCC